MAKKSSQPHFEFPPRSVCATTALAECIGYPNSKFHNASGYYHIKLMLVGKHAVGKLVHNCSSTAQ